jgi:hypothetical protein
VCEYLIRTYSCCLVVMLMLEATRNGDGAPAAVAAVAATAVAAVAATAAVDAVAAAAVAATDAAATRSGDGAPAAAAVAAVDAAVVAVTAVAAVPRVVRGRKGPSGRSPMCFVCMCCEGTSADTGILFNLLVLDTLIAIRQAATAFVALYKNSITFEFQQWAHTSGGNCHVSMCLNIIVC